MKQHDDISRGFVVPPQALNGKLMGAELLFYSVIWTWTTRTGFCRTTGTDLANLFGYSETCGYQTLRQLVKDGFVEKVSVNGAPKTYAAKPIK